MQLKPKYCSQCGAEVESREIDGKPRETHVEKALECIRFGDPERAPVRPEWMSERDGMQLAHLARSDHFAMNMLRIDAPVRLASDDEYRILALIQGTAVLPRLCRA